jgi:polyisoprenyl-phosphate glycosyltransferase
VVGRREGRVDPGLSKLASSMYWSVYRKLIEPNIPKGGVDIFGCTAQVRDQLLALGESNTSLVAQLFWLGFTRREIGYQRLPRSGGGQSGWSFRARLRYMSNSIFAFTDFPIRLLIGTGVFGICSTIFAALLLIVLRVTGSISIQGYTPIMLSVLFVGALNLFAIGIVGAYVWRGYENTKQRPISIIRSERVFNA